MADKRMIESMMSAYRIGCTRGWILALRAIVAEHSDVQTTLTAMRLLANEPDVEMPPGILAILEGEREHQSAKGESIESGASR